MLTGKSAWILLSFQRTSYLNFDSNRNNWPGEQAHILLVSKAKSKKFCNGNKMTFQMSNKSNFEQNVHNGLLLRARLMVKNKVLILLFMKKIHVYSFLELFFFWFSKKVTITFYNLALICVLVYFTTLLCSIILQCILLAGENCTYTK